MKGNIERVRMVRGLRFRTWKNAGTGAFYINHPKDLLSRSETKSLPV